MKRLAFDRSLRERWTQHEGGWRCEVPVGWMQGRSAFGGLTAALLAGLGRRHVGEARILRTASQRLVRPLKIGPAEGVAHTIREGKGVSFVEVRILQEGVDVAVAHLVFVVPREGSIVVAGPPPPDGPGPEGLREMPYIEGVIPEFTQHFDLRWAQGPVPFSGGTEARFLGYCRYRGVGGDEEGILGLLDAWPSPSIGLLDRPTPSSTVSWTAHLLHVPEDFDGWFSFEYQTVAGVQGFHTVVGHLHGPGGRLVGWTEQLVALFD